MESHDSPEIPDRRETSDIRGLPSGAAAAAAAAAGIVAAVVHVLQVFVAVETDVDAW